MIEQMRPPRDDRSLGELFADLTRELTTLVRQEAALAKTEMSQKAASVGKDVGFIAAGGAIAYAGLLAICASLILILGQVGLTWWASALLVGIVVGGIGGFLAWKGVQALKRVDLVPRQTLEALTEERPWRNG
jgi:hypothetical protein